MKVRKHFDHISREHLVRNRYVIAHLAVGAAVVTPRLVDVVPRHGLPWKAGDSTNREGEVGARDGQRER